MRPASLTFAPLRADDVPQLSVILGQAFAFDPADTLPWLETAGLDNVRVARQGKHVAAGLIQVPVGQFFGGKSVPMVGLSGVAVSMVDRGKGLCKALVSNTLAELSRRKVAISTLYPASQHLYRSVGYERAGKLLEVVVPTKLFRGPKTSLETRLLGTEHHEMTERLYRHSASGMQGYCDRGSYLWSRVRTPRQKATIGVGFFRGTELEAYLYFAQSRDEPFTGYHTVTITDAVSLTGEGYDAIVRFLGDQSSTGPNTYFRTGPSCPLLMKLGEQHYKEKTPEDWMVRIVDVEQALTTRGYPVGLRASLGLRIRDPLLPKNDGAFALEVEDGSGSVRRLSRPNASGSKAKDRGPSSKQVVSMEIKALAPLFTGYLSATSLARLGMITSRTQEAIALADAVFASPTPGMCERF